MSELTYDDFKQKLSIHDVLIDAGYHLNRRDGLKYPSYVRLDANGRRIRGDKFLVSGHGTCCFQPPVYKNYNIISFIKQHPNYFRDYEPGMSPDRLVNLVCNRLLHNPVEERKERIFAPLKPAKPFNIGNYTTINFETGNWDMAKRFYPFFVKRGIDLKTQNTFRDSFMLAGKKIEDKKPFMNLAFPMRIPGKDTIVGLEERGMTKKDGKSYKGMAAGSNASEGLWIANLTGKPLQEAEKVYWFESAYDAMAFHQLKRNSDEDLRAVYVSTGGNPGAQQFTGLIKETPHAEQHLCFDNDLAGNMFTVNFTMVADKQLPICRLNENGHLEVKDLVLPKGTIELSDVRGVLNDDSKTKIISSEMTRYLDSLKNRNDIFSGETDYLPKRLLDLYGRYESLAEEYYSSSRSGLVCKEELEDIKNDMKQAHGEYKTAMEDALGTADSIRIVRELPQKPYKDWNDQLLGNMQVQTKQDNEEEKAAIHFRR